MNKVHVFFCLRHFSILHLAAFMLVALLALAWGIPALCGPIHDAARDGDLKKAEALLKSNPGLIFSKGNNGATPLHYAAASGHKNVAELLLAHQADVNVKDNDGFTPLHSAAFAGNKDVAEFLLANGAEINAKDNNGNTPLGIATSWGNKNVEELLSRFCNKIHDAARDGDLDKVKALLQSNPDLVSSKYHVPSKYKFFGTPETEGWTPLHFAVRYDHLEVAQLLLASNAEINSKSDSGETPLHEAVRIGVKMEDKSYMPPMSTTRIAPTGARIIRTPGPSYVADKVMAELLLSKGANVNAQDNNGWTPLALAATFGDAAMVELLLANHADANIADKNGSTPLQSAAFGGRVEVVNALTGNGRDLGAIAREYKHLIRGGYEEFEGLLIQALNAFGDKQMAEDYLNSGNSILARVYRPQP